MFLRLDWHSEQGVYKGLNLQTLQWFCTVYAVDDVRDMVENMRLMERAALGALASASASG